MKTETFPLAMPEDLMAEVRRTAKATGLSLSDAMRQGIRFGLVRVREELSERVTNVDPLPRTYLDQLYREREDDLDSIRQFIAAQPKEAE